VGQPAINVKGPGRLTFGKLRCSQAKPELAVTAHSSADSFSEAETMVSMSPEPSLEPTSRLQKPAKVATAFGSHQAPETPDKLHKNGFSHALHLDSPDGQDQHQGRGAVSNLPGLLSPQPSKKKATAMLLPKTSSRRENGGRDVSAVPYRAPAGVADASVKRMAKRLQTQARKYLRNDSGWFSQSKERFFAVTGELTSEATSGAGNGTVRSAMSAKSLALSWFDDKAAWKCHSRPLGSIPLACIRSAALTEPALQGTEVTLRFADVPEDLGQPCRMRLVFDSTAAALEWSHCMTDLIDLLREP